MLNVGDYFGPLKCRNCGTLINEVAYSGDDDNSYCMKCWAVMGNEAAHRRECKEGKRE